MNGAFNAACNMATSMKPFNLASRRYSNFVQWSKWDAGRVEDMLENLRTGDLTTEQEH